MYTNEKHATTAPENFEALYNFSIKEQTTNHITPGASE